MAGDGIGEFKAVDGILPPHLEAPQHRRIALVHEHAALEQARLVAVAVEVLPLGEDARVGGKIAAHVGQKVRLKVELQEPVLLLAHVVALADDAVDEVEGLILIERLAPIVQRADELFAVDGELCIGRDAQVPPRIRIDARPRAVGARDDLIGFRKEPRPLLLPEIARRNDDGVLAVLPDGDVLPRPRHRREPHDGIVLLLPHDLRQRAAGHGKQRIAPPDGRQLRGVAAEEALDAVRKKVFEHLVGDHRRLVHDDEPDLLRDLLPPHEAQKAFGDDFAVLVDFHFLFERIDEAVQRACGRARAQQNGGRLARRRDEHGALPRFESQRAHDVIDEIRLSRARIAAENEYLVGKV